MSEARWSLVGLSGFAASGVLFTVSSLRAGDPWSLAGCVVWLMACAVWAVPLIGRVRSQAEDVGPDPQPSSSDREAGRADRRERA